MRLKDINKMLNTNYLTFKSFEDKVNWYTISKYQKLSEDFIEKYQDKVDWDYISKFQKLSEDFIEKYQDKVNWYRISSYREAFNVQRCLNVQSCFDPRY